MEYEELIKIITKEVMSRLEASIPLEHKNETSLLILTDKQEVLETFRESLQDCRVIIFTEAANLSEHELIVLPELSLKSMASLALGLAGCGQEELLLRALLQGKGVYALKEGLEYKCYEGSAAKSLYALYRGYEERLEEYGVKFVTLDELKKALQGKQEALQGNMKALAAPDSEKAREDIKAQLLDKKLISERDLKKFYLKGIREIHLAAGSIITPLAMDYIRMNKIKINRIIGD